MNFLLLLEERQKSAGISDKSKKLSEFLNPLPFIQMILDFYFPIEFFIATDKSSIIKFMHDYA